MCELLASTSVKEAEQKYKGCGITAAFAAFNTCRYERTQWLIQSSRRCGDLYEWRANGIGEIGEDIERVRDELDKRNGEIWHGQISEMIHVAMEELAKQFNNVAQLPDHDG